MEEDLELTNTVDAVDSADGGIAESLTVEPTDAGEDTRGKKKPAVPKRKPSPGGQAVAGGDVDDVLLSRIVFKNQFARKSLSVHHMQRRLAELGYRDAYTDKDGWYGDLTLRAVALFQADEGLAGDGMVNIETLQALFHDDPNVRVIS